MTPDLKAILDTITTPNEDGSTTLIAQWPYAKHYPFGPNETSRYAYFVWTWTRFFGGSTDALPSAASRAIGRDPNRETLLALAKKVAQQVYGTTMAGPRRQAAKWGLELMN